MKSWALSVQRQQSSRTMKVSFMLACLYCVLFTSTNFANKYVLSELRFTYPTIFQGWQTLVGVIMFRALLTTGHIENLLHGKEWHEYGLWLPGMMCFLISIYSGSKALASLPIPVFLVMQNIILVFKATTDLVLHKQITTLYSYLMLMLSVMSAMAVAKTDPQYDPGGYLWVSVHVISSGIFEVYTSLMKGRLKFGPTERLFCCYFYSVIVLAPSSYFLGDALEAARFPYLYFAKFYVGCILSGVLGMLLNLNAIRLHELSGSTSSILDVRAVQGVSKILCCGCSLAFYHVTLTHSFTCFLAINLLCSFGYSESSTQGRHQNNSSQTQGTSSLMTTTAAPDPTQAGSQYLKRHELQQDMIRIELG